MIEHLDYHKVPFNFAHCFQADCPKSSTCLRYQAGKFIPVSVRHVQIINPHLIAQTESCSEYLSDTPVRYAYGISHLFDNLPYNQAKDIKFEVVFQIGKSQFYRMRRGEIGLSPKHQQCIRNVFKKYGIVEEPVFERYESAYMWHKR